MTDQAFTTTRAPRLSRRTCLAALLATLVGFGAAPAGAADKVTAINMDWATYNPLSVLIKAKGLMEKEFAKDGITINWKQSGGSNIAVAGMNSKALDFGSTAGAATLLGRVNGGEFKAIYTYSKPEWVALEIGPNSPIKALADLRGKRIAAAKGTDAYIFAVQALKTVGMTPKDVKMVLLQHDAGRRALESGEVDAWVALDPLKADAELKGTAHPLYRNADFCTYGVLNVRDEFGRDNPALVSRVLGVYEEARKMAKSNPAELKTAMVAAAGLPDNVIALQLERTDLASGVIGSAAQRGTILGAAQILQESGTMPADVDAAKAVDGMFDPQYFKP